MSNIFALMQKKKEEERKKKLEEDEKRINGYTDKLLAWFVEQNWMTIDVGQVCRSVYVGIERTIEQRTLPVAGEMNGKPFKVFYEETNKPQASGS